MEIENQNYFDDFEQPTNIEHSDPTTAIIYQQQDHQNIQSNQLFQQIDQPFQQIDQKKQEMRQKYLEQEQIRMNAVAQKLRDEEIRKQEIRNYAQQELSDWYSRLQDNKNKQREINQAKNLDYLDQQQDNNPWNTIANNIDLKEQDYKGSKDVTRMKQAILAKKNDLEQ